MENFLKVIDYYDLEKIFIDNFFSIIYEFEEIPIENALNRIVFEDIYSKVDLPSYNKSSVDGYAVKSSSLLGCGSSNQIQLKLIGSIQMGEKANFSILENECVYIPTGGYIPDDTDAILMEEDTDNYEDGYIYCNKPVYPGENMVFSGDDVKKGEILVKKGEKLNDVRIGLLSGCGFGVVKVFRRINVGVVSTGDEIIKPFISSKISIDDYNLIGKVFDSNTYFLQSYLKNFGCNVQSYGILPDNYDKLYEKIQNALIENDLVIVSGGSSKGQKDNTAKIIDNLGNPGLLFHGISLKPGKPTILGNIQGKPILGLPGHPGAVITVTKIIVRKLLEVMMGINDGTLDILSIVGTMGTNYPSNNGRTEFVPVKLIKKENKNIIYPIISKSAQIKSFVDAEGFIFIDRNSEGLNENDSVEVILI